MQSTPPGEPSPFDDGELYDILCQVGCIRRHLLPGRLLAFDGSFPVLRNVPPSQHSAAGAFLASSVRGKSKTPARPEAHRVIARR
jgi:hypothetical protein